MSEQVLCKVSELPAIGQMRRIVHHGSPLCVANEDGAIAVLDDVCTHDCATSLADGEICAGRILCPRHGWAFDLRTGELPHLPSRSVQVYQITIEADEVKLLEFKPERRDEA
ncbi:Rieske 2Fe-2S domain-containing protein [Edaphobacter sp. HDX4]|uniref:Rieske (2Fe-2S) protein n=1 Tax=Edaphobacter sp. HDX4 TaxID=2794064 RepID=UPI003AC944AF